MRDVYVTKMDLSAELNCFCIFNLFQTSLLPLFFFQGEILFNSWLSMFSGDGAVYNPQVPLYSFDGRNVMTDQTW